MRRKSESEFDRVGYHTALTKLAIGLGVVFLATAVGVGIQRDNLRERFFVDNKKMLSNSKPVVSRITEISVNGKDTTVTTKVDTVAWIIPDSSARLKP